MYACIDSSKGAWQQCVLSPFIVHQVQNTEGGNQIMETELYESEKKRQLSVCGAVMTHNCALQPSNVKGLTLQQALAHHLGGY